jgi:hypothetical protein
VEFAVYFVQMIKTGISTETSQKGLSVTIALTGLPTKGRACMKTYVCILVRVRGCAEEKELTY